MKIVYSDPKTGKSAQIDLPEEKAAILSNFKIGDTFDGALIDLNGYKFKITGGSDTSGFPMNKGIQGSGKSHAMKLVAESGKHKGEHRRMTSRGNTIISDTAQVNMVIIEYGEKPVEELFPKHEAKQGA
ncbi:MAG: S6e family ribosomal protein, partial [Candidatus Micrarchaeaceae archaeon]